jgi:glutamyl-tRNA synthetase
MNTQEPIITRFAPSPTGELHIGSARTALFAYLAAKVSGGKLYLRIEDTDRGRYVEGSEFRLIEALDWFGIEIENKDNIVFQSKRLPIYKSHAFDLVKAGKAYVCTCTKERLTESRATLEAAGKLPRYDGHCRELSLDPEKLEEGTFVIRLKMPETGKVVVNDLVRGDVEFDLSLFDDQILYKSDGYPTYHLASVVDDHEMGINYVLRAEEWLSSTPKHIVLYEAFGWRAPKFGHFSMILATDRSKLSKRHGAASIEEFRCLGYLKEAIINFTALMGWNPKTERELFTLAELEKEFKIENLNRAPAVFDINKLNSFNEHYIVEKIKNAPAEMVKLLKEYGLASISDTELDLIGRGGHTTLKEAAEYILELRKTPEYDGAILIFKKSDKEKTVMGLTASLEKLSKIEKWETDTLQETLSSVVADNMLTNGDVFWPVRVALSGAEKSPSPVELLVALGKEESIKRIETALEKV